MAFQHFFYDQVMPQLPKKWLSHSLGALAHLNLSEKLQQPLIQGFARYYGVNIDEAERPLAGYATLGEFFSRRLKEGARPIEGEIVHPCDGVLIESGRINENTLIQSKGKSFTLDSFIPGNPWQSDFQGGSFFTYYLAPHNYHRVHAPLSGQISWSTVIPGELWPVNSWSVRNIDGLYVINERVATGIATEFGRVILVMVGATNVGSITMSYDPNIKTNCPGKKEMVHRDYPDQRRLEVGDELGVFHLGSTVVLLFDKTWDFKHLKRQEVLMGQKLNKNG